MSSVFRRNDGEPIEASSSWELAEQVADVLKWLSRPENAELVPHSVLDIGFNSRLGNHVAVQGEVIPISLMEKLTSLNVELWLSIYPPLSDEEVADS
ncbi:MAG: hypothetical protein K8T25_09275 [Planctomycetia bacterium]|nr:hypothetical protein [Planctomycetia bacterium]